MYWITVTGVLVACALWAVIIPRDKRLWVALGVGLVWWTTIFMERLPISALTLRFALLPVLVILAAALGHPRSGGTRLPQSVWVYPIAAAFALACSWDVLDFKDAMVSRIGWLLTTLAALAVARAVTREDVRRLINTLAAAGTAVLTLFIADIALHPDLAFAGSYTRYGPWGTNPNSVGTILSLTAGALVVSVLRARDPILRAMMLVLAAAAVGITVLTASRGNLLMFGFALVPLLLFALRRRPVAAVLAIAVVGYAAYAVTQDIDETRLERLTNFQSGRGEVAQVYFQEVEKRPYAGLMFSEFQTEHKLRNYPLDEHNSYLRLLYLGGLALFIPVVTVSIIALRRGWRWVASTRGDTLRPDAIFLGSVFAGMFVFGYTNRLMYEPVGVWPLMHVLLAALMLKFGAPDPAPDPAPGRAAARPSVSALRARKR